jgi:UDP-2,4-diacetamido-2,4,6-trideoxy-beta-L-altropyranose hydrolase
MKVIFRVDSSIEIGSGHILRCITLAIALRDRGVDCHFVSRNHQGNLIAEIKNAGFSLITLPELRISDNNQSEKYAHWLGTDWKTDAEQTLGALGNTKFDWLIVDHYAIDHRWERAMKSIYQKIMVIDDLADREHNCDVLLDQNLGATKKSYRKLIPKDCKTLIGPDFALLRPEFSIHREESLNRRSKPELKNILISFGGMDPSNETAGILNQINFPQKFGELILTVVLGKNAPWINEVIKLAKSIKHKINIIVDANNMGYLMATNDLIIGGAGISSWERCCLGVPTLVVIQAPNQENNARTLEKAGAALILKKTPNKNNPLEILIELEKDKERLREMSEYSRIICDGNGANRTAAHILEKSL